MSSRVRAELRERFWGGPWPSLPQCRISFRPSPYFRNAPNLRFYRVEQRSDVSCFMATKQSPSNLPALPSPREKPWVQPGSAGREAALCRGQDASFVDRVQLLRAKLATLRGPVVVVDVCSGGCSYSQLIPEYPNL